MKLRAWCYLIMSPAGAVRFRVCLWVTPYFENILPNVNNPLHGGLWLKSD